MVLQILINGNVYFKSINLLFGRRISYSATLNKRITNYPVIVPNRVIKHPEKTESFDDKLLNSLKDKLVFNSLVTKRNSSVRWVIRQKKADEVLKLRSTPVMPISLKYLNDGSSLETSSQELDDDVDVDEEIVDDEAPYSLNLPYSIVKNVDVVEDTEILTNSDEKEEKTRFQKDTDVNPPKIIGKKWMSDYEVFEEEFINSDSVSVSDIDYGTPDPNILPSRIPCGGCGAFLHCQSPSIPGYLPKELFLRCSETDLQFIVCQRCTFLKQYNIALSVTVDSDTYPKMLKSLRNKHVLAVLLADMTDIPCSIWPDILDVIGHEKPIMLVGNKIDLIPGDTPGWLENARNVLRDSVPKNAKVIHTALISAKTGFGVEELINKLHTMWASKGDVYLIGCTNVGKSSLFNVLLHSDYCKSQAIDLIQRATTSPWPGTTLNLLKFPILKLSAWQAFVRTKRLITAREMQKQERYLEELQNNEFGIKRDPLPQIIGDIGLSFPKKDSKLAAAAAKSGFLMPKITQGMLHREDRKTLNPADPEFKKCKWCFDSPGVVHQDQIINLLTTDELIKTLPSDTIKPRIYSLYTNQTIFIGGLARIDLVASDCRIIRLIVYSSASLPVSLCPTEHADEVYSTLLGTIYMAVPHGPVSRLQKWPLLKNTQDFEFEGKGLVTAVGDIVLSSAGWVTATAPDFQKFTLRPFTPEGRGIHLRKTPLLRFTAKQRSRRVPNTPGYFLKRKSSKSSHAF